MFFKIVNGNLQKIPNEFVENGCVIIGYTEAFANAHGYYEVIWSDPPDDTEDYIPIYTLTGNKIIQTWRRAT